MIFDMLSSFVLGLIALVLLLFPSADGATVSAITNGVAPFKEGLAAANWLIPVGTLLSFAGIIFTIEIFLLSYKTVMWLLKNISLGLVK